MDNKEMFKLKFNYENDGRYYSMYFNAKVDGDVISVADLDDERNQKKYADWDGGYKKQKEIFDAHKNYISYELIMTARVKSDPEELEEDEKNDPEYEYEWDNFVIGVEIGKRKSITRNELIKLIEEQIKNQSYLDRVDWNTAQFEVRSIYDLAFHDFTESYVRLSDLTEMAMNLVKNKSILEKVITNLENKTLSTKQYLELFSKAYSWDNKVVVDKIIKNRFKNPQCFEIKTDLNGAPLLWSEGHGRDFSYEFIPTKKDLKVYAEVGTKIDTEKVYTKDEVKELLKDKNLIVVDDHGFWRSDSKIPNFASNITQKEVDRTIKESITKEMLMKDYKEFMNFYKLNKIEIGMKVKEIKAEKDKEIKKFREEKAEGDKAVKILDSHDYEL